MKLNATYLSTLLKRNQALKKELKAAQQAAKDRLKKTQEEKVQTMKSLAATIAHELRTPLGAIQNQCDIQNFLPDLLEAYEKAKQAGIDVVMIRPQQLAAAKNGLKTIEKEAQQANHVIDMLLMNIRALDRKEKNFTSLSIASSIDEALTRYPFLTAHDRNLVHFNSSHDFQVIGDNSLIVYIVFNLIKNALYYLSEAGKGEIYIWLENQTNANCLYFKDTGLGIHSDLIPNIFDQFFCRTRNGSGLGLSFCKMAMNKMRGNITCHSVFGEFAEFCLKFPKIHP